MESPFDIQDIKAIKPNIGRVMVELENLFDSQGFELPDVRENQWCKVIIVGQQVPGYGIGFKEGDYVLINTSQGQRLKSGDRKYVIQFQADVYAWSKEKPFIEAENDED